MAIERQEIAVNQVTKVLTLNEDHFSDLKAIEIAPAKLTRAVAALANADGGELFVGIDEDTANNTRSWRGFGSEEDANSHVQVMEKLFPLGTYFQYSFLTCNGYDGLVLQIQVQKTPDIKVATDGRIYVRRGAQNLPKVDPAEIKQLEYTKGIASFENETVRAETSEITNSVPMIEFMFEVIPSAEPEAWARKQQLIRGDMPTVAGILLFSEEPQALIPKRCGIKIYRYATKDESGSRDSLVFDPITIEGHAYKQIRDAVNTTIDQIEQIKKLGEKGLEAITYPAETLHEIITNAVLHRDYSIADDVHIRIFDNRVEVQSPGRLAAHVTVDNILDERFARNGTIVRLINKFPDPPNKDVGEGLNTAFDAMKKLGLKAPTVEERENSLLVVVRHESLASPETVVLEYLETHDSIWNKQAREICNISADYVVKDLFGRLADRGLIEKVPGTDRRTTAYRKGPRFHEWRKEDSAVNAS